MEEVGSAQYEAGQPIMLASHEIDCCQDPFGTEGVFIDEREQCPVDEITGMPLPIAPHVDLNALSPSQINEHHHFYPRLSPILRNSLGGRALRVSRIQRVATTQHNFGENPYHRFFPNGPEIPVDPTAQLGLCVLACAGYLPAQVVDTSRGEPVVRTMKDWEYRRLSQPSVALEPLPYQVKRYRDRRFPGKQLFEAKQDLLISRQRQANLTYKNLIYGFDPMKNFMLDRVLDQDFSDIDKKLRRKFLEQNSIEAGLCILAIGSRLAAESATINGEKLGAVYRDINNDGRLHPLMPESPSTIIKHKLGHITHRVEILPFLRSQLNAEAKQRVA